MTLNDYFDFLTDEQRNNACGLLGYLLELAVKDYAHKPLEISKPGKVDISLTIDGKLRRVEVKENGGDFRYGQNYQFFGENVGRLLPCIRKCVRVVDRVAHEP